mgnify:CR=1 FL=1
MYKIQTKKHIIASVATICIEVMLYFFGVASCTVSSIDGWKCSNIIGDLFGKGNGLVAILYSIIPIYSIVLLFLHIKRSKKDVSG